MWPFAKKKDDETVKEVSDAQGPECAACGKPGADKRYGGQWWHKKCLRKLRKQAKGLI